MSDAITLSDFDLARDLLSDLAWLELWKQGHPPEFGNVALARRALMCLPTAIRRALAAEAKLAETYCAYCGFAVAVDADASIISEHIRTCDKHPMRAVERERDKLRAALRTLVDAVQYEDLHEGNGVSDGLWAAVNDAIAVLNPAKPAPTQEG